MNFLLESALLIGLVGGLLSVLAAYTGVQLAEKRVQMGAAMLFALTIVLVAISLWIETDREQLRRTMREMAVAVQNNDHERLFAYFHPNASSGVQHAKSEVPRFQFHQASVTSVRDIVVNDRTQPPTAITEFIAAFRVSSDSPQTYGAEFNSRRFVKVYWMKQGERWLVRDYEHADFMQGFTNESFTNKDSSR